MIRFAALVVGVLLVASAVARGHAVRVVKSSMPKATYLFWVEHVSNTDVNLYAVPDDLHKGQEFDVIDSQGYFARMKVEKVEDGSPGCPTAKLAKGYGKYITMPKRQYSGEFVAVGPTTRNPISAASVLAAPTGGEPPMPPEHYQRTLIDLDGDKKSDLVRDNYACPRNTTAAAAGRYAYCYDTWARRKGGDWVKIVSARYEPC